MSSQQYSAEIQQDIQNIRRSEQLNHQNIVSAEAKVITNTEQSIAQDMPIVTEMIVTKEFIPVTYEKVIQKIPVVVGQRVITGAPVSQEKYVQGMNVEYVQNAQQTRVDITPQMTTQSTGVQQVISQPLNMAAERISQQNFTQVQSQQQLVNQQQFQNQQQTLPQRVTQVTEEVILEAQHLRPGQVYGQQQQNLLGQQGLQQQGYLGQQGLQQQQHGFGQNLLGHQQQGFGQNLLGNQQGLGQNLLGNQQGLGQNLLGNQQGLGHNILGNQQGQQGGLGQNLLQKERNVQADLGNIERNIQRKI